MARAFFAAADEIVEEHRPAVIKAALAAIRDELKVVREKAALAKAKAKAPAKATAGLKRAPAKATAKAKPAAAKIAKPKKAVASKRDRAEGTSEMMQPPASDQTPSVAER